MNLYPHLDSVFRMGSLHVREGTACQDYAAHNTQEYPFGIISDGCSMSGNTDVGARILTLTARRILMQASHILPKDIALDFLRENILSQATQHMNSLGLCVEDMDATLGIVQSIKNGSRAFLFGDGSIAAKWLDKVEIFTVKWAGNMPGYPMYLHEKTRYESFVKKSNEIAPSNGGAMVVEHSIITNDESTTSISSSQIAEDGLKGFAVEWNGDETPDVLAVFTDGIGSFLNNNNEQIPLLTVVDELMKIKSARTGKFAQRRMNRALQCFSKQDMHPYDDISMAALAMDSKE